ncbi:saccharopine dehydrogenase [Mycena albidolilacea]|uniref:Saccharopine dehydrogenase n=1 Tax=Mycena albidolilacea TaxID=1033008 RepID=A0AAD6ZH99_9AGAR|nr:saccharopine dehydrogenase [Mycena albidolilacea]
MLWFHSEARRSVWSFWRRRAGCKLVENNSWPTAPTTVTIIGLKELEESTDPLLHTLIQFAHCYKNQADTLYDLEFLTDTRGRRVTTFGFHAGFAGAAAGPLALSSQKNGEKLGHLQPFENDAAMVASINQLLVGSGKGIKVLVIGAWEDAEEAQLISLGKLGLRSWDDIVKWDMDKTAKGGPFQEILNIDIFVNCIYLNSQIPSFITQDRIITVGPQRKLSIIVDISCDKTNPFNPTPICSINTTFPIVPVGVGNLSSAENPMFSVVSIDHFPSFPPPPPPPPREASKEFSTDPLLSLLEFSNQQTVCVWTDVEKLFTEKVVTAIAVVGA